MQGCWIFMCNVTLFVCVFISPHFVRNWTCVGGINGFFLDVELLQKNSRNYLKPKLSWIKIWLAKKCASRSFAAKKWLRGLNNYLSVFTQFEYLYHVAITVLTLSARDALQLVLVSVLVFGVYLLVIVVSLVVSTSAVDRAESLVSELKIIFRVRCRILATVQHLQTSATWKSQKSLKQINNCLIICGEFIPVPSGGSLVPVLCLVGQMLVFRSCL